METLQGEGLQWLTFLVRMHKPGCMEGTRVHQEHKELPESPISQGRSIPNPSHHEGLHQAVNEKILFAELKYHCLLPSLRVSTSIHSTHLLDTAFSPEFGQHSGLRSHNLASFWASLGLLFNTNKTFIPKIKAYYIIWHCKGTAMMLNYEVGCTLLGSRSVKNSLQSIFVHECKVTYLKEIAFEY